MVHQARKDTGCWKGCPTMPCKDASEWYLPVPSYCYENLRQCSLGERVSHYASLVVAEKPLEAHQNYRRRRSSIVSGQLLPDLEMGGQVC